MNRMKIEVLEEAGYQSALRGIAKNKNQPIENMPRVAQKLCKSIQGSHRKFLRQISVWIDINAPRYWWSEFDTYKVGVVRNSGSTMHTLGKRLVTEDDFQQETEIEAIALTNKLIEKFQNKEISIRKLKANLPEGFLQDSIVSLNYETLRTIILDRKTHKLPEWEYFCKAILEQIEHKEFLPEIEINDE